ncbi:MAG: GFA family protein [Gammaproteobacteria bacterium]|nr:GFA family protein [Gammaproteobacteria bacterium]
MCGAVRFDVTSDIGDIVMCHCEQCRRLNSHAMAATRCPAKALRITQGEATLKWHAWTTAEHAFCRECGSTLFWRQPNADEISIAAGSLDTTQPKTLIAHIFTGEKGDYYALDDSTPQYLAKEQL